MKRLKKRTLIVNNIYNSYDYRENSDYIAAMFSVLSRFSKATKIK